MRLTDANRRTFMQALVGGAAGLTFRWSAFGQAAPTPIQVTKLTPALAMVSGDGGNIGVAIADSGLMMIDGGYANRATELQKAISEATPDKKVQILFDTHWHGDHIGSNELLGASGVKIIGHENTKKWLSTQVVSEAFGNTVEPLKPEGRPVETFTKGGKLTFGSQKIEYTHYPTAHTDGDAWLFFPAANVIHTGDLFFNTTYPVIDYSTGGWIGGMATALDTLLKVGDAKTRIIPGHGPLASKDDMRASRDMLHTVHERLDKLSKQGKSMDEVLAAKPTEDLDAKWGAGMMKPERFLKMAYPSIAKHAQRSTQSKSAAGL